MSTHVETLPKAFFWRRVHSLTGLWFVVFLIEHLVTNSQAALLLGDNGQGFVRMVDFLHNLPYLKAIEIGLLGVPFAIHMIWGVKYALTSKSIPTKSDGSTPALNYGRNRAYTWQRITSWILLLFLVVHVAKFRFLEYPKSFDDGRGKVYYVKIKEDPELYRLSGKMNFKLDDANALQRVNLKPHQVVASTSKFGTASLLTVRDTFKNPIWVALYTVFVLSAVFHAFNGLWTSVITWGWVIRVSAQKKMLKIAWILMFGIGFLGLAAVWGTYLLNFRN